MRGNVAGFDSHPLLQVLGFQRKVMRVAGVEYGGERTGNGLKKLTHKTIW
jgi:hypothetical protein